MSVGAVGGVGASAAGAAGPMSAAGNIGAAAVGTVAGESNPVTSVSQLEINAAGQKDFNSIDLLIALLLLAAGKGKDDEKTTASTALGFLAGLAMAGALGRLDFQFEISANFSLPTANGADGAGGGLDVSA